MKEPHTKSMTDRAIDKRLKPIVFIDFPLKAAICRSMNEELRRARKLDAYWKTGVGVKHQRRVDSMYRSVQLARHCGNWWLVYDSVISTGGFDTKQEAIKWYVTNGR